MISADSIDFYLRGRNRLNPIIDDHHSEEERIGTDGERERKNRNELIYNLGAASTFVVIIVVVVFLQNRVFQC